MKNTPIRSQLEEIRDAGLVYAEAGAIVYESIIARFYPSIDIDRLTILLGDNLMDWHAAIDDYLGTGREETGDG